MLIFSDTRGQDIGHHGITDGGEAIGDGPGTGGPLEVIHGAKAQGEGKTAKLVVEHYLTPVAGRDISKAKGSTGGIASSIDCGDSVGAEGDGECRIAQLYTLLQQLIHDGTTVGHAGKEDKLPFGLEFAHDLDCHLVALCCTDDGSEARHAAVNHRNSPGACLDIADGSVELKPITLLWLLPLGKAYPLDDFLSKEGGHAGIQGLTEVGEPQVFAGNRGQQALCILQGPCHVA